MHERSDEDDPPIVWRETSPNCRRSLIRPVLLFLLSCFLHFQAKTQVAANTTVQANIIYYFTKYIDWPDDRKVGEFIIGVVGECPLYDELLKIMNNKKVGKQSIVIRQFAPSELFYNCHILFIPDAQSRLVKKIAGKTIGAPVLLVTEYEGLAAKGSCINFTVAAEHLRLEINKQNIEQRHLNIAIELLQLGKVVL